MDFKAVIFDLDGTLLDTLEDLADSMNCVLERNRLPQHELAAYKYFVGDGIDMLVRRALPFEIADDEELNRFIREMKSEYAGRWLSKTRPYPGVPEMLAAFAEAGFEMAVLSNKPDEASNEIVKALLPEIAFRMVMGATPERPKKPDPSAALEIAAPPRHSSRGFPFLRGHVHRHANGLCGRHVPHRRSVGFQTRRGADRGGRKNVFKAPGGYAGVASEY